MTLDVAPALRAIVAPACLAFDGVSVVEHDHRLDTAFAEAESKLRAPGTVLDEPLQRTRALYRGIGLDPTKTRPSSGAFAVATRCRASTRSSTSATGARSKRRSPTASTMAIASWVTR